MVTERKIIKENIKRVLVKEYIRKSVERAGFGGIEIQRTPLGTRITLTAERPGMIIGARGENINQLTSVVEGEYMFENPQIEVQEEKEPLLNAHIMAQKLASAIERGWNFRRAGHSTVRKIMDGGRARGCQIIISGKLTGERHRTERFREGHIKYSGEVKRFMSLGYAVAKTKPGIIGIKVQIMRPETRLPDEVNIVSELKTKEEKKDIVVETEGGETANGVKNEGDKGDESGGENKQIEGHEG